MISLWGYRVRDLKRRQKWSIYGITLLTLYAIFGFLVFPLVARHIAADQLSRALKRDVSIQSVYFNPFTLFLRVESLSVKQKKAADNMAFFRSLAVNLQWSSLVRLAPVVEHIKLEEPAVHLSRSEQGVFNFSDLRGSAPKTAGPDGGKQRGFRFSVANIELEHGTIVFTDKAVGKTHRMENIKLGIPLISNLGKAVETHVKPRFSAEIDGRSVVCKGKTKPFHESLETSFRLYFKALDLAKYMAYVPPTVPVVVTEGILSIGLKISFFNTPEKGMELLVWGTVGLYNLMMTDRDGRPLFRLDRLDMGLAQSRVLDGQIHLSDIILASPVVYLHRNDDGRLNIYALQSAADGKPIPPAQTEDDKKETTPVNIELDQFQMANASVFLQADGASAPGSKTDSTGSRLLMLPLLRVDNVSLDAKNKNISVESVVAAGARQKIERLKDGTLNFQVFSSAPAADEGPQESKPPADRPAWNASLASLAVNDYGLTTDRWLSDSGRSVVHLDSLKLTGFQTGGTPPTLAIDDIHFNTVTADVRLEKNSGYTNPEKTNNKESAVKETAAADETGVEPPASQPAMIDIGRFSLTDAGLRFSDQRQLSPFDTELSALNLEILHLSSRPDQTADLRLSAMLDNQSALTAAGKLNPLAGNIFADIDLTLDNMGLGSLSPYSGRYIGRNIAKGKLFVDLDYVVENQRLSGKNHILIDQLTLGETVDSPDATSLPVQLAIFLLQDRQGKIVLDVPVSGNLDDPAFRLGRTILKTFTNLVARAATSPFSLVSGMLGENDPSHLVFSPGSAEVEEHLVEVLNSLAELLYNRPSLAIELSGYVDREKDTGVLTDILLLRKLQSCKQAALEASGSPSMAVENINIKPEEYTQYLWQAYRQETFARPTNALGRVRKLPDSEMEALMRQHIRVDDRHLKALADQRARQVRNFLLASEKVEPERVFVVEAAALTPEPVDGLPGSRVDVSLKK